MLKLYQCSQNSCMFYIHNDPSKLKKGRGKKMPTLLHIVVGKCPKEKDVCHLPHYPAPPAPS